MIRFQCLHCKDRFDAVTKGAYADLYIEKIDCPTGFRSRPRDGLTRVPGRRGIAGRTHMRIFLTVKLVLIPFAVFWALLAAHDAE
jgi:hypothetical protein